MKVRKIKELRESLRRFLQLSCRSEEVLEDKTFALLAFLHFALGGIYDYMDPPLNLFSASPYDLQESISPDRLAYEGAELITASWMRPGTTVRAP
ncbi:hypothetical protein CEXT_212741 [Caerostris extrusa]|uniref:Uncharacterized protein n=1 Tax=Caerostris extrusa TaxID=172846 RepID=A0AAV4TCH7_CAEEX|nr:hypothetical protein CEXT_212741 [Caerostris extrusa]